MHPLNPDTACRAQLRVVFEDGIVSLRLGSAPTLGHIASVMSHLATLHGTGPIVIDVMLAAPAMRKPAARAHASR